MGNFVATSLAPTGLLLFSPHLCSSRDLVLSCWQVPRRPPDNQFRDSFWPMANLVTQDTQKGICTIATVALAWLTQGTSSHYDDVIMGTMASQITSLTIVCSTVYLDADQRKHQSSASLTFLREIFRLPVNSPHKWPVTRNMSPFDDVIMHTDVVVLDQHSPKPTRKFGSQWLRADLAYCHRGSVDCFQWPIVALLSGLSFPCCPFRFLLTKYAKKASHHAL